MKNLDGNFIALFDSGFGGISNLNLCLKLMPDENYVFYADSKNCPYGKRTKEDIVEIGKDIIGKFYKYNPKALIIACNTMSTSDPEALREPYPDLKIIGTYPNFEHVLKPGTLIEEHSLKLSEKNLNSSSKKYKILILATTATCRSDYLNEKMNLYSDLIDIYIEPADMIVKAVENNEVDEMYLRNYLNGILIPYMDIDALILGCTHFHFAEPVIRKILGNKVSITSGCEIAAKECYDYLSENKMLNNTANDSVKDKTGSSNKDHNKKHTIKIIDAKLTKKRKETFLRLLDFDKNKHDITFSTSL